MKRYFTILSVIALIFIMTASSFAAGNNAGITLDISVDDEKQTLMINGIADDVSYGDAVTVQLLKNGVDIDSEADKAGYTGEQVVRDFIIYAQVAAGVNVSDDKNTFEIIAGMQNESMGYYLLRVNGKDIQNIFYVPTDIKRKVIDMVKEICKKDKDTAIAEFIELIETEVREENIVVVFELNNSLGSSVDSSILAECMYNLAANDDKVWTSTVTFGTTYSRAVNIAALNEGIGDVTKDKEFYSLDEDYVKVYEEKFTAEQKQNFASVAFAGKGIDNAKDVADYFDDGVIKVFALGLDSWGDAKTLIETFGEDMDIDLKAYNKIKDKEKLYKYILNLTVKDTETLSKNINDKIKDIAKSEASSAGGSSGGGGGSGGGYVASAPIVATSVGFADMEGYAWAKEAVEYLSKTNVVSGVGADMFAPGRNITREEMLTMLLRAYGVDVAGSTTDKFIDLDSSAWYTPYVAKGVEIGVTSGVSDSAFGTGRYITREETAAMAHRISLYFGKTFDKASETFGDDQIISDWAKDAVYALKGASVINGTGDGNFAPKAYCTRAEAAQIIYALIKK